MNGIRIGAPEFERLQRLLLAETGMRLDEPMRALLAPPLAQRLRVLGLRSLGAYLDHIDMPAHATERQIALDLMARRETRFFGQPGQHKLLRAELHRRSSSGLATEVRVWNPNCGSGEETWSLAMTLADELGHRLPWSVLGTDSSTRAVDDACVGVYPHQRVCEIPRRLAQKYMVPGVGEDTGYFEVHDALRPHVDFHAAPLLHALPDTTGFDIVAAQGVLSCFAAEQRPWLLAALASHLRPGGLLLLGREDAVGHANPALQAEAPTVFRRVTP